MLMLDARRPRLPPILRAGPALLAQAAWGPPDFLCRASFPPACVMADMGTL